MNVEAAVAVANLCNLGNLAFVLDRKLQWDQAKGEIVGDEEARRLMGRPQRFPYACKVESLNTAAASQIISELLA